MTKRARFIAAFLNILFVSLQAGMICTFRGYAQTGSKPLVAVFDLKVTGGVTKAEARSLSDRLRSEMQSTKRFDLIEREQMDVILKEQDFALSELTEDNVSTAGKLVSAEQVAIGTLGKVGRTYTVDVRLIEVKTGKVLKASKQDYNGPAEGLVQVMGNVAREFVGLPPRKIKVGTNKMWYVLTGLAVAGGGAAAAVLLGGDSKSGVKSFSNPPALPEK